MEIQELLLMLALGFEGGMLNMLKARILVSVAIIAWYILEIVGTSIRVATQFGRSLLGLYL